MTDTKPEGLSSAVPGEEAPTALATKEHAYPSILEAIGLLLVWLLLTIVVAETMKKRGGVGLEQGTRYAIAITIATAIVLAWGWRETRSPFLEVFPFKAFGIASVVPIALLLIGAVMITIELNVVIWRFLPPTPAFSEAMNVYRRSPIRAALVASVTEELLFRGLILSGFLKRYRPRKAIFASALLFAIWHLNPWQFVGALVAGLLFGWWRTASKSLWPGLIAHASVNSIPMFRSTLIGPHQAPSIPSLGQQAVIVGLGIVLMGAGFVMLRARWKTPRLAAKT